MISYRGYAVTDLLPRGLIHCLCILDRRNAYQAYRQLSHSIVVIANQVIPWSSLLPIRHIAFQAIHFFCRFCQIAFNDSEHHLCKYSFTDERGG